MITVENLTKEYFIFDRSKDLLSAILGKKIQTIKALDYVSFEVKEGEVIGIIGDNGAGKSTLLKVLSSVTDPTSGKFSVNGRLSAILDASTGFNRQLTGRENIRQRLMLQGCSRNVIATLEPEIIEFSELEDVIDDPTMTYSSGMAARLAFGIITSAVNDVLFIDELLVVGDEHFQGKCFKKIKEICSSGRTIVIASHDLNYVERLCNRAIWLEKGKIKNYGLAHHVCMAYHGKDIEEADKSYPREYGRIVAVEPVFFDDRVSITTTIEILKPTDSLYLVIGVHDNRLGILTSLLNSAWQGNYLPRDASNIQILSQFNIPAGLKWGLIGVSLLHGNGSITDDIKEDVWGWDTMKQVYFENPFYKKREAYLSECLEWKRAY